MTGKKLNWINTGKFCTFVRKIIINIKGRNYEKKAIGKIGFMKKRACIATTHLSDEPYARVNPINFFACHCIDDRHRHFLFSIHHKGKNT